MSVSAGSALSALTWQVLGKNHQSISAGDQGATLPKTLLGSYKRRAQGEEEEEKRGELGTVG